MNDRGLNDRGLNDRGLNDRGLIYFYTGVIYTSLSIFFILLSHSSIDFAQKVFFPQIVYTILGLIYYSFYMYEEFII
jgi:hypothetical protein